MSQIQYTSSQPSYSYPTQQSNTNNNSNSANNHSNGAGDNYGNPNDRTAPYPNSNNINYKSSTLSVQQNVAPPPHRIVPPDIQDKYYAKRSGIINYFYKCIELIKSNNSQSKYNSTDQHHYVDKLMPQIYRYIQLIENTNDKSWVTYQFIQLWDYLIQLFRNQLIATQTQPPLQQTNNPSVQQLTPQQLALPVHVGNITINNNINDKPNNIRPITNTAVVSNNTVPPQQQPLKKQRINDNNPTSTNSQSLPDNNRALAQYFHDNKQTSLANAIKHTIEIVQSSTDDRLQSALLLTNNIYNIYNDYTTPHNINNQPIQQGKPLHAVPINNAPPRSPHSHTQHRIAPSQQMNYTTPVQSLQPNSSQSYQQQQPTSQVINVV